MDLELSGHVALVTGSSGGLGAAIARRLAEEGASVLVHGRSSESADAVVDEIRSAGGSADAVLADVEQPADVAALAGTAVTAGVDIVVANAGPFAEDDWDAVDPASWARTYHGNVIATAQLVGALLPSLRSHEWGRVVTIGTRAVTTPLPNMVSYSAAKAAVLSLTVSLAQHLAGSGVTANCISPGVMLTPSLERMFRERGAGDGWDEDAVTADYAPNPSGRLGRPNDVADAVAYVVSPRAGYVNGAHLRVDGGITGSV